MTYSVEQLNGVGVGEFRKTSEHSSKISFMIQKHNTNHNLKLAPTLNPNGKPCYHRNHDPKT